ncbi:MAG: single-stranded-DNA-specific exonuclease RecJ [Elusimicrobiota bacterium]
MDYSNQRWDIKLPDPTVVEQLTVPLGVSLPLAKILVNRGITEISQAEEFFYPDSANLFNPYLLADMEKAVIRIKKAIENKEKILVYGDGDTDGVTGLVIMKNVLDAWGADTVWYVPGEEGYGLDKNVLDTYAQLGVKLVITVDCGISAGPEIAYAKSKGMEVIVTDHHEVGQELPDAYAVVNPKRRDSAYPFSELAGCGVAFKFGQALTLMASPYMNKKFAVVDIETTGFHPWLDDVVEIGAIELFNWQEKDKFHSLIRPEKNISSTASAYHGITAQMCAAAPSLKEALQGLLDFIKDKIIVVHNKDFVLGFLNFALEKNQLPKIAEEVIDTLEFSRQHFPFRTHALEFLSREFGFVAVLPHRALEDARTTMRVFLRLIELTNLAMKFFIQEQLDLVCLATLADNVPLVGENRILTKLGIKSLTKTERPGLVVLRNFFSPTEKNLTLKNIHWGMVPLLNAPSRRSKAKLAVDLLLAADRQTGEDFLDQISALNDERRQIQGENLEHFNSLLFQQCDLINDRIFVVAAQDLEPGVTGVVASQISRQYYRPVVLLIANGDEIAGSGRSIPGLNLVEAFTHCQDLLIKFGGHKMAAGLTLSRSNVEKFRERIKNYAGSVLKDEDLVPTISIDAEIDSSVISLKFIEELKNLEPYGIGNPAANFLIKKIKLKSCTAVGTNHKHLQLRLDGGSMELKAIGWGLGEWTERLKGINYLDIVFQLELNIWQEREYAQLILLDLKVCE